MSRRVAAMAPALALGCALISGLLLPLALAPFDIWPLAVLAPALLLAAGHRQSPRFALLLGYLHGLGRYGLGVSWIYMSIHVYGPAPPWLAGTLVGLFVLAMAVFPALMLWLWARLATTGRALAGLAFCAIWVLFEWLLTWFLTGFPWLFVGYAHLATPLAGYAPLGGVLLVSLASVLTGVGLWWLGPALRLGLGRDAGLRQAPAAWAGGALVLVWALGAGLQTVTWTHPTGEPLRVALVQGVIPQDMKWQRAHREDMLRRHLALSEPHWGADLLIWPEAAITWFARDAEGLLEDLGDLARGHGSTLITGIPDYQRDPEPPFAAYFQNTAVALGQGQGQYIKQRLVPFGEYVPLEGLLRGLISFFDLPMSHARSGPAGQSPLQAGSETLAMAICYEIAYPDLVAELAEEATVLVTISNDTWFGDSIGPEQHQQIARMRALELGRPLLRATNDGVTALVDARGQEQARLPRFEADVLTGTVQPMTGLTPFARSGSWPTVLLAFVLLGGVGWASRRGHPRRIC